jgi:glycerol transport system ATP-binding protein
MNASRVRWPNGRQHDAELEDWSLDLTLEKISFAVGGETLISDVSLSLARGTMNVLLGPTLSGKTSLMRLMAGLERPTQGRILIDGKDVTGVPVRGRSVAMVYQQFVNYPTLSVYENIASPLRVAKVSATEVDRRVQEAAKLLGLVPMLQRTPLQLSGGQQQRVAIARALVKQAQLVLLDEPLANLDYKLREELREELPRIFAASGAILIYATTEPTEALLLGGNTATLWEGRVTQVGPTAQVYRQPHQIAAARVFSDPPLNELAIEKQGGLITLADGQQLPASGFLTGLADGGYRLGFRAEHMALGASRDTGVNFHGTVLVTELTGSESFIHVDAGYGTWVCLARGVQELVPGAPVDIHIDTRQIFVFDAAGQIAAASTMAATA